MVPNMQCLQLLKRRNMFWSYTMIRVRPFVCRSDWYRPRNSLKDVISQSVTAIIESDQGECCQCSTTSMARQTADLVPCWVIPRVPPVSSMSGTNGSVDDGDRRTEPPEDEWEYPSVSLLSISRRLRCVAIHLSSPSPCSSACRLLRSRPQARCMSGRKVPHRGRSEISHCETCPIC